jgi:hypothetical protein
VRRSSRNLNLIFAVQFERTVNRDNTANVQNLTLQIERVRWRATLAGCSVLVQHHLNGTFTITYGPVGPLQRERSIVRKRKNRHATGCGWLSTETGQVTCYQNWAFLFAINRDCYQVRHARHRM